MAGIINHAILLLTICRLAQVGWAPLDPLEMVIFARSELLGWLVGNWFSNWESLPLQSSCPSTMHLERFSFSLKAKME
jgi:hypothetical protein